MGIRNGWEGKLMGMLLTHMRSRAYVVGRLYTNGFYADGEGSGSHIAHRVEQQHGSIRQNSNH